MKKMNNDFENIDLTKYKDQIKEIEDGYKSLMADKSFFKKFKKIKKDYESKNAFVIGYNNKNISRKFKKLSDMIIIKNNNNNFTNNKCDSNYGISLYS